MTLQDLTAMKETWAQRNFSCLVYLGWFSQEGILAEVVTHWETETAVLDLSPS